jgi:AraC family transcriptional regulator of adaptative response/methylated-DNA-[protein]-cysteine methyltransferase
VRAVAQACAANALAVAVPCHRVVRTDGKLAGYRWGIERKRALIEREAREHTANRLDREVVSDHGPPAS